MEKAKQPDHEPEKIVRALGENLTIPVSEEEKKYRSENGPDNVNEIPKDKLKCTVCEKTVSDIVKKSSEPIVHVVLGVLMCKECFSFYGDGYFSVDEDGDDKYCRWCGEGGTLYLCSKCPCVFCKKCIKQNLSRQDVKDLESDDWKCLICNPKPLYECRTICWALQEYAQAKKNSQKSDVEEDEEEAKSSKSKRNKSKKTQEHKPSTLRKRKASEIEDEPEAEKERESRGRKSSDSAEETRHKGEDKMSTPSRRSQNKLIKSNESIEIESEEKETKAVASKSRRSKNKKEDNSEDEDSKPVASKSKKSISLAPAGQLKKSHTRSPQKKEEEVFISDEEKEKKEEVDEDEDDDGDKNSSKKNSSESPRTVKSKSNSKKKGKSKQSSGKNNKNESPSEKSFRHSSDKNGKREIEEAIETPVKRSQRCSKSSHSFNEDSDTSSKERNPETKLRTSRRKTDVEESPRKSLTLTKNAKKEVIQAVGFINSALKDVLELRNLISFRCEKLCSKTVQSIDDVVHVFGNMRQITAVHKNLSLIEKGLDTKITAWKSENLVSLDDENKADKENNGEKSQEEPDSNFDEEKENEATEKKTCIDEMEAGDVGLEENSVDKNNFDRANRDLISKNDTDEVVSKSVGAIMVNNIQNNSVSEEEISDETNSGQEKSKTQNPVLLMVEEEYDFSEVSVALQDVSQSSSYRLPTSRTPQDLIGPEYSSDGRAGLSSYRPDQVVAQKRDQPPLGEQLFRDQAVARQLCMPWGKVERKKSDKTFPKPTPKLALNCNKLRKITKASAAVNKKPANRHSKGSVPDSEKCEELSIAEPDKSTFNDSMTLRNNKVIDKKKTPPIKGSKNNTPLTSVLENVNAKSPTTKKPRGRLPGKENCVSEKKKPENKQTHTAVKKNTLTKGKKIKRTKRL